jgi:DNA-binding GntR family transcriptional regulator
VGRTTIRRALAALERDGLIESHPGRGNFVSGGPLSESNALVSLGELAAARGLKTTSDVRRADVRRATLEEADLFGIAPGAKLLDLERLRYLDGQEFALAESLVPLSIAPGIETVDFRTASLYAELGSRNALPVRASIPYGPSGQTRRPPDYWGSRAGIQCWSRAPGRTTISGVWCISRGSRIAPTVTAYRPC